MKILKYFVTLLMLLNFIKSENLSSYFPVKEGLIWKYKVHEKNNSFTQTVKCHTIDKQREKPYDFMMKTNSIRESIYYYSIGDSAINMLKSKIDARIFPKKVTLDFSKRCPIFCFSKDIKEWEWKGKIKIWFWNKHVSLNAEKLGYEKIHTKLGELKCLKLKLNYKNGNRNSKQLAWYAKGIGLVKFVSSRQRKTIIDFQD